jgi:hypothetical protein
MAVTRQVDARTVGQTFAEMTEGYPDVHGIYVRPSGDAIDVWMLASHSDYDSEDAVFETTVAIRRRFPDVPIHVYLVNPRHYPTGCDLENDVIPSNAIAITNSR